MSEERDLEKQIFDLQNELNLAQAALLEASSMTDEITEEEYNKKFDQLSKQVESIVDNLQSLINSLS